MRDRGKQFENLFSDAVEKVKLEGYQVDIQRLYDVIDKKTINQPADFVCYKKPNEIYVECKSTNTAYFPYYTQSQYTRLSNKSCIDGVKAGMLIWFIQEKRVFWTDIIFLQQYYEQTKCKSISVKKLDTYYNVMHSRGVYEIVQSTPRVKPKMRIDLLFEFIVRESNE